MFLAHDTGPIARPWQASAPVKVGRTDSNGLLNLFFCGNVCNSTGGTYAAAKGTGELTIPLGHDQVGRPESSQAALGQGGIDHIGGTDLHAQAAALA